MMTVPSRRLRFAAGCVILWIGFVASVSGREAEYDVVTEAGVMVPMRDGVRLATDIYRPAKEGQPVEGKFPTILTRTPYNRAGGSSFGKYFAARGYVFVAQDTRGRYGSEGEWHWLTDDGPDGVDCLEWIAKQPWSDGQVGMLGTSYVGGTQHAVAIEGSPHLKTIIPVDAVCNMGHASMRNGGAFEMRFWNWIFLNAGRGSRAVQDEGKREILQELASQRFEYLKLLPLRRGTTPLALSPEYEDWLIGAMEHGANDEYWAQNNILDNPEKYMDIPVYFVGGWYDSWASNTAESYVTLSKRLTSPLYLIMGPWIHGAQTGSQHGQVDFGKEAAIPDQYQWRLEWYDHTLKGMENSVGRSAPFESPVRIFVMGTGDGHKTDRDRLYHGGYWRNELEWPLARAKQTSFYLHQDGTLSTEKPGAEGGQTSYQFDPHNPVPTIGGNISSGNDILLQGAWNQKGGPHVWNWPNPIPLSARNDVLVFQTEPLSEDVEVTGPIEVELWASSDCLDTDFTAKLIDVYPPSADFPGGFDLNITDGIRRARFRESLEQEKLLTPGEVVRIPIKLYPTSNVFKKGHRIRVDISSSNFPRFDVNPNTGEPLNRHRLMRTAVNTVWHNAEFPSRIVLPLVPANAP